MPDTAWRRRHGDQRARDAPTPARPGKPEADQDIAGHLRLLQRATAKTALQITCPRRGPGPAAFTAKTAKIGLEITAGTRAQARPAAAAERHRRGGSQAA
jgi:hypothetical protein